MDNSQNNSNNKSNNVVKVILIVIAVLVGLIMITGIVFVVGIIVVIALGSTSYKANTNTKIYDCSSTGGTCVNDIDDIIIDDTDIDEIKTSSKEITGKVTSSDGINYTLDTEIEDVNPGDTITYKINDNYTIKIVVNDSESKWGANLDVYVNNKKMDSHPFMLWRFGVSASIIGDYLVFDSNTGTDIRSITTYIFKKDGSLVKEIYDLEDIKGMVPLENSKVENGKLVIKGRRSFHDYEVVYGDKDKNNYYSFCDAMSKLDPSLPILQDYTFEIKNEVLDLDNPTKEVKQTLKEYYDAAKESGRTCE